MLEARSGTFTPQRLKSSVTSDRKLPRLAMFQTTSQLLIATMMNAIRIIHKRFKFAPSFLFPSSQQVEWEEKEEQKDKKQDTFVCFDAEVDQEEQKGAQEDEDVNPNDALINNLQGGSRISAINGGTPCHKSCQDHGPVVVNEMGKYLIRVGIDEAIRSKQFFRFHGDEYRHEQSVDRVKEREVKPCKAPYHQNPNRHQHRSPGNKLPAVGKISCAECFFAKVARERIVCPCQILFAEADDACQMKQ